MYEVTVNNRSSFQVDTGNQGPTLGGQTEGWSCEQIGQGRYSVIYGNSSYIAILNEPGTGDGNPVFRINGQDYSVAVSDPGRQAGNILTGKEVIAGQVSRIRAPMPGLIRRIFIKAGQEIRKGDPVLVLEAMKMENQFNSPADGRVKEISVMEGLPVEKGGILFVLE